MSPIDIAEGHEKIANGEMQGWGQEEKSNSMHKSFDFTNKKDHPEMSPGA